MGKYLKTKEGSIESAVLEAMSPAQQAAIAISKKEKEKYDIKGIATVFKNAMFGMAFIIIIGYCLSLFLKNLAIQNYVFWISIAIGTPYLIIKSNSKEFKQ